MLATRIVSCGARRVGGRLSANRILRARGATECVSVRFLSINDVFGRVDFNKVSGLPDVPTPPLPRPSLDELVGSGQSVLEELGLWTWWKPSSWFRWGMESMHIYFDLPWWSTIVIGTVILRLALIKVTVMSQKSMAIQSRYKPELDKFRARITDARAEANNQLVQQILMEQNDFLRSKDIRTGRQLLVMLANGGVFMTNFFAIRKMAKLNYPGWENGGALWFTNLTACDPYYVLPAISAATLFAVVRVGVDSGASSDQLSTGMRLGMQYGLPIIVLVSSSQFASALCVYWCTTNMISLVYAGLFKLQPVRNFFNIPPLVKHDARTQSVRAAWADYKAKKNAPPTLSNLRKKDQEQFRKAGSGKPMVF